jgi:hypothetical protein
MIGRIVRSIISVVVGILPLLYLAGYLSFIPGLPAPASLLGAYGLTGGSGFFSLFGGGAGTLVPFGAFGLTGLIIYTVLSRAGSIAMSATAPRVGVPNMTSFPFMGMQGQMANVPEQLPADITKSQYVILRAYRQGLKSSKDISKSLSMDKNDVESQSNVLKTNGYLTKDSKLTTKALDLLS